MLLSCAVLSCAASAEAVAGTWSWSDVWSTPEQRGQQLLDSKQAAEAAPLFKDPRRRGYAESRAGEYAKAAESLAPLHDADSLYNRGNALAHTGKLHDALDAYNAALAKSPGNPDIARNRDLVARALEEQQHQQGKQGQQGQGGANGKAGNQQSAGGQGQAGSQGQSQANNQGQAGSQGQSQASNQGQANNQAGSQAQSQAGNQGASGSQGRAGDQAQSGNQLQSGSQPQSASAAQAGSSGQSGNQQALSAGNDDSRSNAGTAAATGRNSATNPAMAAGNSRSGSDANALPESKRATATQANGTRLSEAAQPPPPPRSEQSLALDQWLRGIPDDSAELLRRKFLIEHMLKQRNEQ